jgi:uncharacterized protein (DUF1697 family)
MSPFSALVGLAPSCPDTGRGKMYKGGMMRYIALLRGVNVGGHGVVKMDRLRELFAELGLANVRTYIQSGNVFFDTEETDRAALVARIEKHLRAALGYNVLVFLRTVAELEAVVASDAFTHLSGAGDMRLCVMFLAEPLPSALAIPYRSPKGDVEVVRATASEAYVVWHIINGRPPAAQSVKGLGERNTTRFFHTTAKILEAAKQGG